MKSDEKCKNWGDLGGGQLICEVLVWHGKKLVYLVEYLRIDWADFHRMRGLYARLCHAWVVYKLYSRRRKFFWGDFRYVQ